jgi:sugar phosphate isomerase/epimerase
MISCASRESQALSEENAIPDYSTIRIKEFPLAVQCWTFREFTFLETLEQVNQLDIKYIQAYPGQALGLSGENSDTEFGHHLSEEIISEVKEHLDRYGIRIVAYGVVEVENDEESLRSLFEFAREMGIRTVVMEPTFDDYSLLDELAQEYWLKIAIHNHPTPSKYARPETVQAHIDGTSRRIGACADTGHWLRTGIVPVEGLRMLKGRLADVHLKDLNELGNKEAYDVPFGQGVADIRSILAELTRQNYGGYLTVEHEKEEDAQNPLPAIREGIEFIRSVTYYLGYRELLQSEGGWYNKHGWNHYGPGYFALDNESGILTAHGGMGLFWFAQQKFGDFILELDFRVKDKKDNSGIFYRIPEMPMSNDYIYHSFEIQIDDGSDGVHSTGAVYDAVAPSATASLKPGEWNHYKITCRGARINVELNEQAIVDWEMEPSGKIKDFADSGYIGLQNHDRRSPVQFRNLFIKEL